MNTRLMLSLVLIVVLLTSVGGATAHRGATTPTAPQAAVGTGFTFQGQLKNGGGIVNGNCDMTFMLYDDAATGVQIGSTITATVPVSNSLFTVMLNANGEYRANAFDGYARWLEVSVKCAGDATFTTLSPRQQIAATAYAFALPGLYTLQNSTSPNIIGGYNGNSVTNGVLGATISGGGSTSSLNRVTDNYGTVGGGDNNRAGDDAGTTADITYATISGGQSNTASGTAAVVGGGYWNTAGNHYATVSGGWGNNANGNDAAIGGGSQNAASASDATISGGAQNNVTDVFGTVGGGRNNRAGDNAGTTTDAPDATVSGGQYNTASGTSAVVGGGYNNTAGNHYATVSGGWFNNASGNDAVIGGGSQNTASSSDATISGGSQNTASAIFSSVPGGSYANASHYGQLAYANGGFNVQGDAQTSVYVLRNSTSDSTPTELLLDGASQRITLTSTQTLVFDILIVGRSTTGASAGYQITGVIENINGTTTFVGTPLVSVLGEDIVAWNATVLVDDNLDALVLQVTGTAVTTIRWVGTVRTVEVLGP